MGLDTCAESGVGTGSDRGKMGKRGANNCFNVTDALAGLYWKSEKKLKIIEKKYWQMKSGML